MEVGTWVGVCLCLLDLRMVVLTYMPSIMICFVSGGIGMT